MMISNGSFRLGPSSTHRFTPTFCRSTITLIPIKRPIEPSMVHETTTKDIGEKYPSIHLLDSNFAPYIIIFELTALRGKKLIPFFLDFLNSLNFGIQFIEEIGFFIEKRKNKFDMDPYGLHSTLWYL